MAENIAKQAYRYVTVSDVHSKWRHISCLFSILHYVEKHLHHTNTCYLQYIRFFVNDFHKKKFTNVKSQILLINFIFIGASVYYNDVQIGQWRKTLLEKYCVNI